MKFAKNKIILIIIFICVIVFVYFWINQNTGLKEFEKEVLNIQLPNNVEKISVKSGISDSGGNGDYSTYRVVLVIKTEMTIDKLKEEFNNKNMTFLTHKENSELPFVYITKCESNIFESSRNFRLVFDDLEKIEDFSNYYFLEFIK